MRERESEKIAERIANPQNAADLALALQTPGSPAYLEMMNNINQQMAYHDIIHLLAEKYLAEEYEVSEREKEEIRLQLQLAELVQNQMQLVSAQSQKINPSAEVAKILSTQEVEQVKAWLEEMEVDIENLEDEIAGMHKDLHTLQGKQKENVQQLQAESEKEIEQFQQQLAEKNLSLQNANGELSAAETKVVLQQAMERTSTQLERINQLLEAQQVHLPKPKPKPNKARTHVEELNMFMRKSKTQEEKDPAKFLLAELRKNNKPLTHQAAKGMVVLSELKIITGLTGEEVSGALLLDVLKKNKKPLSYLQQSPEKYESALANARKIKKDMIALQEKMVPLQTKLEQEKSAYEKVLDEYKARLAKESAGMKPELR